MMRMRNHGKIVFFLPVSKKSPTGPSERTPKKPEYLIALATYLGFHSCSPIQFLIDSFFLFACRVSRLVNQPPRMEDVFPIEDGDIPLLC